MSEEIINAAIDVETTGLIPGTHEIVQISLIVFDKDINPLNRFLSYIKPIHPELVDPVAMEINKLSLAELAKEATPGQVRNLFMDWKESHFPNQRIRMVGQNVGQFDYQFLKLFFKDIFNKVFLRRVTDVSSIAMFLQLCGLLPNDLETDLKSLLKHFNIVPEKSHDAYHDALTTLQVLQRLVDIAKYNKLVVL